MKRIFLLLIFFSSLFSFAQSPVEWKISFNKEKNEIEFKATIKEHWHLYSQHVLNEMGPVPTSFHFDAQDKITFVGPVIEPKAIEQYDSNFEATLNFFEKEVVFTRKVAPNSEGTITGFITFMVCDDTRCIPPTDFPFSIKIP